jgi:hypothetical protein
VCERGLLQGVCGGCAKYDEYFDEDRRPLSVCPVCDEKLEEPYLVVAKTLARYRMYDP